MAIERRVAARMVAESMVSILLVYEMCGLVVLAVGSNESLWGLKLR